MDSHTLKYKIIKLFGPFIPNADEDFVYKDSKSTRQSKHLISFFKIVNFITQVPNSYAWFNCSFNYDAYDLF